MDNIAKELVRRYIVDHLDKSEETPKFGDLYCLEM